MLTLIYLVVALIKDKSENEEVQNAGCLLFILDLIILFIITKYLGIL